jgi:ADP-L-glycero-D-manno-heptose 6-epimerase
MKNRIIVTGGAGFIGSQLVAGLNRKGHTNITIVDALGTGMKWKNLVGLQYENFIHKKEFLCTMAARGYFRDVKAVFHMGACSATTELDADYLMTNNVHYSIALAEASLKAKARFIYASSAATYGLGEKGYSDDHRALSTLKPLNMYGYSKHLFDLWALRHKHLKDIVGLKFFNVFGPHEHHKESMRSMILKAFEQIQATGQVKLFKSTHPQYVDGGQMRDFVYVKDCVDVMLWLLDTPRVKGIFNLGTGTARTWNDLAAAVFAAMGKPHAITYIDMPQSLQGQYQDFTQADMTKLRAAGYRKPFTSLEAAVQDYIATLHS